MIAFERHMPMQERGPRLVQARPSSRFDSIRRSRSCFCSRVLYDFLSKNNCEFEYSISRRYKFDDDHSFSILWVNENDIFIASSNDNLTKNFLKLVTWILKIWKITSDRVSDEKNAKKTYLTDSLILIKYFFSFILYRSSFAISYRSMIFLYNEN
jgi:hypothetical protein